MNVEVQFHQRVREDLNRWATGEGEDENRAGLVGVYVDELVRILKATAGEPPGAVRLNASKPRLYRWEYTSEVEIEYQVRSKGPGAFHSAYVRIVITELRLAFVE